MRITILVGTLLVFGLFFGTWVHPSRVRAEARLGINLSDVSPYATQIPFVDVFRMTGDWISHREGKPWGQGGPLEVNRLGEVVRLAPGQFAEKLLFHAVGPHFPAGVYTCYYDGKGRIAFGLGARIIHQQLGQIRVRVDPKRGGISLQLRHTDPQDPVRNIRLILPGYVDTYQAKPFHPTFLQHIAPFKVYRFVGWQHTNNSSVTDWEDRTTLESATQGGKAGVAIEIMVDLCNLQNADPWFLMPHLASDVFVRRFAQFVHQRLDPERKVYLEHSNEVWNRQFAQGRYALEQGQKLGLSKDGYEAQLRYHSQRSVEVFRIWQEVFGGHERLVRVLSAQAASPWSGTTIMDWRDAYRHADAVAIAPYFGGTLGSPKQAAATTKLSVQQVLNGCETDIARNAAILHPYARSAKRRGLRLIAYEGGQGLVGSGGAENNAVLDKLFQAANRHPGMKDVYRKDLQQWQDIGGDLFCVFASTSRYTKYGSWGILEYQDQDPKTAPKYQAFLEFMRSQAER